MAEGSQTAQTSVSEITARSSAGLRENGRSDGAPVDDRPPALRVARVKNPFTALGLAVNHLMRNSAYTHVKFSAWSKILAGQINRGHYRFVMDRDDRVIGMLGWALTDRATAERWVQGEQASGPAGVEGSCIIFNVWSADTQAANLCVLDAARMAMRGCETLYYRRLYSDGRSRPVSLSVNQFVRRHIDRRAKPLRPRNSKNGGS